MYGLSEGLTHLCLSGVQIVNEGQAMNKTENTGFWRLGEASRSFWERIGDVPYNLNQDPHRLLVDTARHNQKDAVTTRHRIDFTYL